MKRVRGDAIRLALFLGASFAVFLGLFSMSGGDLVPGGDGYRMQAVLPNSYALAKHADVRQAGVPIGEVTAVREQGTATAVMLELDDDHAPVYRDGRVLVRSKSVAGESYLELDPGHPAAGAIADGGVLPIDRADAATQIDDVLSILDAPRRRQLQRALDGLGGGLDGHGDDLNRTFEGSSALVRHAAPVAQALAAERTHVASLVDSFGRVSRALGDRKDAIRLFVTRSKLAAEAVAARDDRLRSTVDELPGFLRQSRGTATRLKTFSVEATPVVRDLRLAAQDLVPAVDDLRPAAAAGRRAVRELGRFAVAARPALQALPAFSRVATNVVAPLSDSLRQLNPLVGYLGGYREELSVFLAQIAASTEATDTVGHLGRIMPVISRSALPGTLSTAEEQLLKSLTDAAGSADTRGYNAYPKPGEAGKAKPFSGSYPRLEAEPPYR